MAIATKQNYCSGVLISKSVVLTAAHCFKKADSQAVVEFHDGTFGIGSVVVQPAYDGSSFHDMAIVKLEEEVKFDLPRNILLSEGPQTGLSPGRTMKMLDQNFGELFVVGAGQPDFLWRIKKISTPAGIITYRQDTFLFSPAAVVQIGDSGGPVLEKLNDGKFLIIGVTSRVLDCN